MELLKGNWDSATYILLEILYHFQLNCNCNFKVYHQIDNLEAL